MGDNFRPNDNNFAFQIELVGLTDGTRFLVRSHCMRLCKDNITAETTRALQLGQTAILLRLEN